MEDIRATKSDSFELKPYEHLPADLGCQSKYFSSYQDDQLVNKEEFMVLKERFQLFNKRTKIDGSPLTMRSSLEDFFGCGPAFPQFFQFLFHCFILNLIALVFLAPFVIHENLKASDSCQDCGELSFLLRLSMYSTGRLALTNYDPFRTEALLIFSYAVIMALYLNFMLQRARKTTRDCQKKSYTPCDYSVLVEGFPEPLLEDTVKSFFAEHCPQIKIESIIIIPSFFNKSILRSTVPGSCIVTLETHRDQVSLLKEFNANRGLLCQAFTRTHSFRNHKIWISRSPDPQDLLIDNFGYSTLQLIIRYIAFIVIIAIMLLAFIGIQLALRSSIPKMPLVCASLISVLTNKLLVRMCSWPVNITKARTNTIRAARYAYAVGFAQVINIVGCIFFYHMKDLDTSRRNLKDIYEELAMTTLLQTFVPVFFVVVNISYHFRAYQRSLIEQGIQEDMITLSQIRKAFFNPEFHIEEFYSVIISLLVLYALVGSQLPILYWPGAVGMICYYWALKRHFIYYTQTPVKFSCGLIQSVTRVLYLTPIIMILGFRLFAGIHLPQSAQSEALNSLCFYFVLGTLGSIGLGMLVLEYLAKKNHNQNVPLREITHAEAKEQFPQNFKTDYDVVINSLLDFRLEILSFS